jgi:hypothetical protein
MSNDKHTPLPWVANGRYIGTPNHLSYVGEVRDENGNWSDTVKSRGDAAFIVRACNSHYELLDCLKEARRHINGADIDLGYIDEVIAKATPSQA